MAKHDWHLYKRIDNLESELRAVHNSLIDAIRRVDRLERDIEDKVGEQEVVTAIEKGFMQGLKGRNNE